MAKEDIVRRWLEIAAEDLEVAESNQAAERVWADRRTL